MKIPELIAPAGDWECVRAAVENGADALYFGLERHNARMRAENFTLDGLPALMEFLHRRGVRGYVTFNTLIFAEEIQEAEEWLRDIIKAGADAVIVQDVGLCRLIRRISPDFPIHASTQMTITSAAGVQFARELGCSLVVLARECSVSEISRIREEGRGLRAGLPLEIFIHGALCVAYSGQCLTSESLGGRSANRGVCAQACRMPFDLVVDGTVTPLGDRRYLLSPRDLAGLEVLPDLVKAGASSLKIEGRLKSPEYVANITRLYRTALDRIAQSVPGTGAALPEDDDAMLRVVRQASAESHYDMEMAFSRGLHTGWLRGTNNQELVHARFGKKRGVYLGEVARVRDGCAFVRLEGPLKPGDGIVFDAGHPDEDEEGGRVYAVRLQGREARLEFGEGDINFRRVHRGDRVWKTSDPELDRRLRHSFEGDQPRFRRPVVIDVSGRAGESLVVEVEDERGNRVRLESSLPLQPALKQPLTDERLAEQLGRLGGTPFRLGEMKNRLAGNVMLPVSELNRMRRELTSRLEDARVRSVVWSLTEPESRSATGIDVLSPGAPLSGTATDSSPELIVLVRSLSQLETALRCGVRTVYCEFEDPKRYRDAVSRFRQTRTPDSVGGGIWVAPPRVFKPGEDWILKLVRTSEPDGYLVRNYDHLRYFEGSRCIGDYTFNVANALSASYFMERFGLERLTASYDLNIDQLEGLLRSAPPHWFEVTIHQHMPMFHMEHCVYCAFMSEGTDYTNCGRPCDRHDVKLRDRVGAEHHLRADAGCRNTVFNALAQTGADSVPRMLALGVRRFRVEFMYDDAEAVERTIERYEALLSGEISGTRLWHELKILNQLGVTRGTAAHR
jgi:U32 family peptidase